MTPPSDFAQPDEPSATPAEETLAHYFDEVLTRLDRGEETRPEELLRATPELIADGARLTQVAECLHAFGSSLRELSYLVEAHQPHAAARTPDWPDPFPGRYRVKELLGEGAFGRVWLAEDLSPLGRLVALKAVKLAGPAVVTQRALEGLRNEARVLAGISHPHVVHVYDWLQHGDDHYLVLQYVPGGSLAARLRAQGPFPWQQAARYAADVGEALLHVHAHGVIHRDVKPANVLWEPGADEAVLTDFGLSTRLAGKDLVAGTPLYMAPEAFRGQVTPAGDVYGLAATLFTLVAGEPPFPADNEDDLRARIDQGLSKHDPRFRAFPEPLEQLLRAALTAGPDRRSKLHTFVVGLRGVLNQLLADTLAQAPGQGQRPAPVDLRLIVSRRQSDSTFAPVSTTHPQSPGLTRDLKRVPPPPGQVRLRTGERVRLQVVTDRPGHVAVFNVGPTGNLNLLYPSGSDAPLVEAHQPLDLLDVELTPPAGRERVFAVWSQAPLPLRPEELLSLAGQPEGPVSQPYHATRDMKRLQESVQRLPPNTWHAVVLELDHEAL
jgi:serine/threonine protein kinase